jgi:beta-catenin-like protein 1
MMSRKSQSMEDIVKTLQIYHDNVDDDSEATASTAMEVDGEEPPPSQRDILRGLIYALGGGPEEEPESMNSEEPRNSEGWQG